MVDLGLRPSPLEPTLFSGWVELNKVSSPSLTWMTFWSSRASRLAWNMFTDPWPHFSK